MLILFVSGQSGAGKTTLGNNLSKEFGFRHLDGDVFYMGRDPFGEAGTYHEPKQTPEQKIAWDLVVKNFNTLFQLFECKEKDNITSPPTVDDWTPALDILSQAVADDVKQHPENQKLVVSFSVYQQNIRQWLIDATRQKLPSENKTQATMIKYVVLNDSQGGAPKRKLEQTKAAAAAEGKTMDEFLAKFGYKEYPGDDAMLASNMRVQNGFEPGVESKGEIAIEISEGMDATAVLKEVAERLGLTKK